MSQSSRMMKFDAQQAALALPELERTAKELLRTIDHYETLSKTFREIFLNLFQGPEITVDPEDPQWLALRSAYFHLHADLGHQALTHLRYAADLADLACGLIGRAAGD